MAGLLFGERNVLMLDLKKSREVGFFFGFFTKHMLTVKEDI